MVRSVGVLLVHGMGIQPEGDTLAYMGDPLLTWASAWLAGHDGRGYVTGCTCGQVSAPRHVHARWDLKLDPDGKAADSVEVLIAESWWSNLFDAPAASRISDWITPLIWGVGWRVFLAGAVTVGLVMLSVDWFSGDRGGSLALGTALAVTLCILVALLPAALLLVGKLPGKLGDASVSLLNFLTLWVGDAMVYQQNPRNAFAARAKILQDLKWVASKTGEVIIAAHSLGSLLSIEVLASTKEPKVKFFATFGSPVKLLKLRSRHYLDRLDQLAPATGWANFYDPLDFIGGAVDNQRDFPYNIKVDNGRSIIGAHGGYPDNAEQFQEALYRLIIFNRTAAAKNTAKDDKALELAFRSRQRRFINGTWFMVLSLPSALAGASLLYGHGWAQWVAAMVQGQLFIPGPVVQIIGAAASDNQDEPLRVAGTLLICLATTAVLAIFLLWVGHLVLMIYEARAEEAVAAGDHPWTTGFRVLLILIWLAWLLPILCALLLSVPDNIGHLLTLLGAPTCVMLAIGLWMLWVRRIRHLDFTMEAKQSTSASMDGRAAVAVALGKPFIKIKYSRFPPTRITTPGDTRQLPVPEEGPAARSRVLTLLGAPGFVMLAIGLWMLWARRIRQPRLHDGGKAINERP